MKKTKPENKKRKTTIKEGRKERERTNRERERKEREDKGKEGEGKIKRRNNNGRLPSG